MHTEQTAYIANENNLVKNIITCVTLYPMLLPTNINVRTSISQLCTYNSTIYTIYGTARTGRIGLCLERDDRACAIYPSSQLVLNLTEQRNAAHHPEIRSLRTTVQRHGRHKARVPPVRLQCRWAERRLVHRTFKLVCFSVAQRSMRLGRNWMETSSQRILAGLYWFHL